MESQILPKLERFSDSRVHVDGHESGYLRRTVALEEVCRLLGAEVLWATDRSLTFDSVGAADLMSDVLAFCRPGMLLLTGLATVQTIRTASIADLHAVVFVRGKRPDPGVVALAAEKGIPLLTTPLTMFEAAGLLYQSLSTSECDSRLKGRGERSGEESGRSESI
jgi:predicted transcriptional regulator